MRCRVSECPLADEMVERDRTAKRRVAATVRRNQETFADKPCRCCGKRGWRAYRGSGIGFSAQGWRWLCQVCYRGGCGVGVVKCRKESQR